MSWRKISSKHQRIRVGGVCVCVRERERECVCVCETVKMSWIVAHATIPTIIIHVRVYLGERVKWGE